MPEVTPKTPVLDRKLPRRAAGYIAALLYAFGVANVLVRMNSFEVTGTSVFATAALALLILCICFYNKITATVSLLLALVAAVWFIWFSGTDFPTLYDEITTFFTSVLPIIRGDEVPSPEYQILFANLIAVLASLLAYVTAARLSGSISLTLSAGVLFIAAWYLEFFDVFLELALCSAVIASVSAASFGRKTAQSGRAAVAADMVRDTGGTTERRAFITGGTAGVALFMLPLLIVVSLIMSQVVMPGLAQSMRSKSVNVLIDDLVDFIGKDNPMFTRRQLLFSLGAAGFGDAEKLGGPVILSTAPTLRVNTYGNFVDYLRGATRTYYTGSGWQNDRSDGSYRYGAGMWSELEDDVFDRERPPSSVDDAGILTDRVRYTVAAFRHNGTLFTIARPEEVISEDVSFVPYFNRRGDMYPKELLAFSSTYTVSGYKYKYLSTPVVNYIVRNENRFPESEEHMAEIYEMYGGGADVAIPAEPIDNIPLHQNLAYSLARQTETDSKLLQAIAIRDFLRNSFEYTLSPSIVPSGEDFVDYFLRTGEGYCVYFASAMAVMARDIGIPSRYVEGYLLTNAKNDKFVYTLTGENAHAWAELYFEGFGWVPFDATALGIPEDVESSQPTTIKPPEEPSEPPIETPPSASAEPSEDTAAGTSPWVVIANAAASIIVLFGLLCGIAVLVASRLAYSRLVEKHGNVGAIKIWWHETTHYLLPAFETRAKRQDGETALELSARLGSVIPNPVCSFKKLADISMRAYYAENTVTEEEATTVWEYYRYLRGKQMKHLTPAGWLFWHLRRKHNSK